MMSMSINDLASIQTNSTEDTENKIIHFFNDCNTNTYSKIRYKLINMQLYIYSYISYLSDPEAKISSVICSYLEGKLKNPVNLLVI